MCCGFEKNKILKTHVCDVLMRMKAHDLTNLKCDDVPLRINYSSST